MYPTNFVEILWHNELFLMHLELCFHAIKINKVRGREIITNILFLPSSTIARSTKNAGK